ncbi:hypothetical protein HYW40_01205, partial [Candidatus Curtissbacteria bacterium]|nr:hypothetical protein [Candidatus Curtissbacteria bacterium]
NQRSNVHFLYKQHESLDQVYMFNLFYNKVDPFLWQANGGTRLGCGATGGQFSFERYHFFPYGCLVRQIGPDEFSGGDLVVTARSLEEDPMEVIKLPGGEGAFYVYRFEEVGDVVARLLDVRGL